MEKVLVTGGAGFIGSHIVDLLLDKGYEVIVIDNLSSGHNLNDNVKFYKEDIRNTEGVNKIFKDEKPDYVIHTAAQISVPMSVRNPRLDADINVMGLINVLEASKNNNVKKVVFSSTGGAMYGDTKIIPTPETVCPKPPAPYGIAKLYSELMLANYKREFGLDFTALRYGNVYGPRQDGSGEAGVIAIFTSRMLNNEEVTINGDGKYVRDYVYVKDVARANLLALNNGSGEVINIGTGKGTDVNELFKLIKEATNYSKKAKYGPARPGDLRKSILDNSKAKLVLSWEPMTNLREGIKETVEFFRNLKN